MSPTTPNHSNPNVIPLSHPFTNKDCIKCISLSERELVFILNKCLTTPAIQEFFSYSPYTYPVKGTGNKNMLSPAHFALIILSKFMSSAGPSITASMDLVLRYLLPSPTPTAFLDFLPDTASITMATYHPFARIRSSNLTYAHHKDDPETYNIRTAVFYTRNSTPPSSLPDRSPLLTRIDFNITQIYNHIVDYAETAHPLQKIF